MTMTHERTGYDAGENPVPDRREPVRGGRRRAVGGIAPALVVLGAACIAVTVVVVVWTHLGQRADERSRWSIAVPEALQETNLSWLDLVSIKGIALGIVVVAVLALLRRRPRVALAAAALVAGANVTTQILKAAIPRPYYGIGADNSLPSGHTTVLVSLALGLILALPRPLRTPCVLLTSAIGTFTGAAVVAERWHRPSDVVAAFGVCGLWAGIALLLAGPVLHRGDVGRRFALHLVAGLVGAAAVGAFLLTGGLVAHGEASNVLVGGVMLSVLGVACAVLAALVAAGADARDELPASRRSPSGDPLRAAGGRGRSAPGR